jgi:hypothetical protein
MAIVEDIRADLESELRDAERRLAAAERDVQICRAALDAHDRVVSAMREQAGGAEPVPASPDPRRRRDIAALVLEVLNENVGFSAQVIAAEINVKRSQVEAALMRLRAAGQVREGIGGWTRITAESAPPEAAQ